MPLNLGKLVTFAIEVLRRAQSRLQHQPQCTSQLAGAPAMKSCLGCGASEGSKQRSTSIFLL